jgi:NADP-dependent 3-hydroxy acid dehydrogenase YdfG
MNIVISGGSSGLGLAMTREFVNRKHNVLISSRSINKLSQIKHKTFNSSEHLQIFQCDVQDYKQVEKLGRYSAYIFDNKIDHWINSAAVCEGPVNFEDLELEEIHKVISTNLLGTLYGCKVAQGYKARNIYMISGHGSNGYPTEGFPIYGLCKAAIRQFSNTHANAKASASALHTIAPGIMRTELTQKLLEQNKLLDLLARNPEDVAKIIVPKILGISGNNQILRV